MQTNGKDHAMGLKASDFDQSRFFKAADFDGERLLRISNITEETLGIGADQKTKPVIWFTNESRGLPLNVTNLRSLAAAFGDEMSGWVGRMVAVFPSQANFRGQSVPSLR